MRTSLIISNYNYGRYLRACLDSVVRQTEGVSEIVLVDDGSVDESVSIALDYLYKIPIKVVAKKNSGQLSAFNIASEIVSGDVIFFLDSDDLWGEKYVETALQRHRLYPKVGFISFKPHVFLGYHTPAMPSDQFTSGQNCYLLRGTRGLSIHNFEWLGSPTSGISLKKALFKNLLPLPSLETDWRTRADDVIVLGASILGAGKLLCGEGIVYYRKHEENAFLGKLHDEVALADYSRRRGVLVGILDSMNLRPYSALDFLGEILVAGSIYVRLNAYEKVRQSMSRLGRLNGLSGVLIILVLRGLRSYLRVPTLQDALGKKCLIFGAGNFGESIFNEINGRAEVLAFLDSDTSKVGGVFNGILVRAPTEIFGLDYQYVIFGGGHKFEIYHALRHLSVPLKRMIVLG